MGWGRTPKVPEAWKGLEWMTQWCRQRDSKAFEEKVPVNSELGFCARKVADKGGGKHASQCLVPPMLLQGFGLHT